MAFPEAQRSVADGKLLGVLQPTLLQAEQQAGPGLRALAKAVGEADQLLLALRRGTDLSQDALSVILKARLQMNAVGPDIGVSRA
jgi:hypothetical protein